MLASHVWQQAHNGFTQRDPGFIDHVVNNKAAIVRVYLPPDANCLLSTGDKGAALKQHLMDKLQEHYVHIREHGLDMPEIRDWKWAKK